MNRTSKSKVGTKTKEEGGRREKDEEDAAKEGIVSFNVREEGRGRMHDLKPRGVVPSKVEFASDILFFFHLEALDGKKSQLLPCKGDVGTTDGAENEEG